MTINPVSAQQRVWVLQNNNCSPCRTDNKVYVLFIIGRVLQAAAIGTSTACIGFSFLVGPIALLPIIPAIAFGALGTWIAGGPQELNQLWQASRPFIAGQPVGLSNGGNNCWLNSSLQLLANSPSLHRRLRQIPEFSQFLDSYAAARGDHQKMAKNIDTDLLRQLLSRETAGQISSEHKQEDAAQLFEYLFEGSNTLLQFDQQLNSAPSAVRREPMLQLDPGSNLQSNFRQLFNNFFDCRSDIGQRVQLFFQRAPDEFLLQIKRFYQRNDPATNTTQLGKINAQFDVPQRLGIPQNFMRSGGESPEYICDGFILHIGENKESGHYISYIKVKNTWWYCSDFTVYEVSSTQAHQAMKDGYIFHFAKAT